MKRYFLILAAAALSGFQGISSAQEFTYVKEISPGQIFNEMVASSKYRPKQVATLETFEMPLILDGKAVGMAKVKAGTPLNLVSVKPEGVIVELNGNQTTLAVEKTDLISRYAARKAEVDAEFEAGRLALIEEGQAPMVFPEPFYVPEKEEVTKIVYIDTSEPRIRVNNGAYWPYTGGYYPYPASYVYQPYYQNYWVPPVCYVRPGPKPGAPVPPRPPQKQQVLPPVKHPFAPARPGN